MMSYQDGFVVSVINQNKPIREFGENGKRIVHIPFGSEYKLRIKNNNYGRALARVTIDGTDVMTGGKMLVLKGYDTIDLERFVDDLNEGKRFKFISLEEGKRTGAIQDPTSPENGKVRVEFYREKLTNDYTWVTASVHPDMGGVHKIGGVYKGGSFSNNIDESKPATNFLRSTSASIDCSATLDCATTLTSTTFDSYAGATAEGSSSSQEFTLSTDRFETEAEPVVIELWLRAPKHCNVKADWVVKINQDGSIRVYSGSTLIRTNEITLGDRSLRFKNDAGVIVETSNFVVER